MFKFFKSIISTQYFAFNFKINLTSFTFLTLIVFSVTLTIFLLNFLLMEIDGQKQSQYHQYILYHHRSSVYLSTTLFLMPVIIVAIYF